MSEPSQSFDHLQGISHFIPWIVFRPTPLNLAYLVKCFRSTYQIQVNDLFALVLGASLRLRSLTGQADWLEVLCWWPIGHQQTSAKARFFMMEKQCGISKHTHNTCAQSQGFQLWPAVCLGAFISLLNAFPHLLKKDLRLNQRFPNVHKMGTSVSPGGFWKLQNPFLEDLIY